MINTLESTLGGIALSKRSIKYNKTKEKAVRKSVFRDTSELRLHPSIEFDTDPKDADRLEDINKFIENNQKRHL